MKFDPEDVLICNRVQCIEHDIAYIMMFSLYFLAKMLWIHSIPKEPSRACRHSIIVFNHSILVHEFRLILGQTSFLEREEGNEKVTYRMGPSYPIASACI